MTTITELHVNGTKHRVEAETARSLLSVLREDLEIGPGQICRRREDE